MSNTTFLNVSEFYIPPETRFYTISEVIQDYCASIPRMYYATLLFIFSFYILSTIIIPKLKKIFGREFPVFEFLRSMFDTVGFGFTIVFIIYGIIQGAPVWFNVWVGVLGVILSLSAFSNVYVWVYDLVIKIKEEWRK